MALGSGLKETAKVVPLGLQSENLHKSLLHEKKKMVKRPKLTLSEIWNLKMSCMDLRSVYSRKTVGP